MCRRPPQQKFSGHAVAAVVLTVETAVGLAATASRVDAATWCARPPGNTHDPSTAPMLSELKAYKESQETHIAVAQYSILRHSSGLHWILNYSGTTSGCWQTANAWPESDSHPLKCGLLPKNAGMEHHTQHSGICF